MAQDHFPDQTYEDIRFSEIPFVEFDDIQPKAIVIKQDSSKGRGGYVWDAAYVLARYLAVYIGSLEGKRVIELGAGCALPSVAAANLGAVVVSTDIAPALDLTVENVALNSLGNRITTAKLDWASLEDREPLKGLYDIVLLSDLFYLPSLAQDFLDTLLSLCSPSTQVFLTYKYRTPVTIEPYLERLRANFDITYLVEELRALHPEPKLHLALLTLKKPQAEA